MAKNVGYEQYNAVIGFQIMPIQFKNTAGTSSYVDVLKYIDYSSFAAVKLTAAKKGQGLQIWIGKADGVTYNKFYYIEDAYDEDGEISGEVDWTGTGWADASGNLVADVPAKLGLSVWLVNGTEKNEVLTLSGEVSNSDETLTLASGFQLAACPFPMAANFDSIKWKSISPVKLTAAKKGSGTQFWILKPDGVTYTKYYYIEDAYDEDGEISGEVDWTGTGWADASGNLVAGKFIDAAQGMWIVSPGADEATFTSPIK